MIKSNNPRRQWWELSLNGIKEAAQTVGDIGRPVLDILNNLRPLLISLGF